MSTVDKAKPTDIVSAGLVAGTRSTESAVAIGQFNFECIGADGKVKWTGVVPNLVVNTGLAYMAGSALTSVTAITAWYVGLYGAGASNTPAAGDTMASHAGWTEVVPYSNATRVAAVPLLRLRLLTLLWRQLQLLPLHFPLTLPPLLAGLS
jgi:hypothetical protein